MPTTTTRKGYDVAAITAANKRLLGKANGWLSYGGDEVPLWVQEVTTGWSMSGSTAQSSRTRSFFPRNFQQPSFTISCQFPSQREYADVAQFVRRTHKGLESATFLEILGVRTGPIIQSGRRSGKPSRRLKGPSQNIAAEGYVDHISRTHEQGVYSPEQNFNFVIERIISPGAWADKMVTIRKLKSWHDIVQSVMAHDPNAGFTSDPDANVDSPRPRDATDLTDAQINKRTGP